MMKFLVGLLRHYDVDIMDSLSYFTHETDDSVDSFIGRWNSSIDSDKSGSNESNTSNSGDSDDYPDIPILIVPGNDGSNRGDSDKGSHRDNGGSSSRGDSGIENRAGTSWLSSLLSQFWRLIDKIILKQLLYFGGTSIDYILSWINMNDILGYITTSALNFVVVYFTKICFEYIIRYIRHFIAQINELNQITTLFSLSAANIHNTLSTLPGHIHYSNTTMWNDLQGEEKLWSLKLNNPYLKSSFKKLVRQLGLMSLCCSSSLPHLFSKYFEYTQIGSGMKSLLLDNQCHRFVSNITQVRTCIFDKSIQKFVWGVFNILVFSGIGVVVWYRDIQVDYPPVDGIPQEIGEPLPDVNAFKNPNAVINGYKRATFLINKDIQNTVITAFQLDPTFMEIIDIGSNVEHFELENQNNIAGKHILVNICTAVIVASLIATKAVVLPA